MQFWPPDDEHMCSKHIEAWHKLTVKQKFCASSWLITDIYWNARSAKRQNLICRVHNVTIFIVLVITTPTSTNRWKFPTHNAVPAWTLSLHLPATTQHVRSPVIIDVSHNHRSSHNLSKGKPSFTDYIWREQKLRHRLANKTLLSSIGFSVVRYWTLTTR